MTNRKKIFYCLLFLISGLDLRAQNISSANLSTSGINFIQKDSLQKLIIKEISVSGNNKTKLPVILHELPFNLNDSVSVSKLHVLLDQARVQLYNTTLFDKVRVESIITSSSTVNVSITVKERWYIYPVPQFQLVDRNFNDWYKTFNHSLTRVNYGLKFADYSLTGKRDQLNVYLINGYSRNISFSYNKPYSNAKLNRGYAVAAGYTQNREIAYNSGNNNRVLFYPVDSVIKKTNNFVRNGWFLNASYLIRKGFFKRHYFLISYTYLKVDDSVILKNANYFKDAVNAKGFPEISYTYQYNNVDNVAYSLIGTTAYLSILKRGFGFNEGLDMLSIDAGLNKYFTLKKNWFANFQLNTKIKFPFEQGYFNQRGLGYGDAYLRGLEYNVIDGVVYALLRTTLKKKLFSFNIPFPFIPKILTKIPFTFFAKTYSDIGYVYNKTKYDTYLSNRLLYTGGFGIDVLTLYDINLRFEYSFNQLHEKGLFFHTQNGF